MSETSSLHHDHGLQLERTSERSLSYFLAESVTNLLTDASAAELEHIADFTAEIRRRNKQPHYWARLIAEHLRH
jgi:hypothetical protein